jgi:hypothetical protein
MKLATIVALAALMAADVRAGQAEKGGKRQVTVYIWGEEHVPFEIRTRGLKIASDMFSEIGVSIRWRHCQPAKAQAQRERALSIRVVGANGGSSRETVSAARPYEGSTITVFFKAMNWASEHPLLARAFFAHVLVHEITHNLQQIDRHSRTGIMKERWTREDSAAMLWNPLRFEQKDIDLIHAGLDGRTKRMAAMDAREAPSRPR